MENQDPRKYIGAGRRLAVKESASMENFYVAYSPRNGDGAPAEGTWDEWVNLAKGILEADGKFKAAEADPVIPKGEKKMVVAVLTDKEPPDKEGRQRFDLFWLDTWPHDMSPAYMESKGIKYKPGEHYVRAQCYRASLVAQKQRIESQRGMAFFVWDREPKVEDFLAYENS